MDTEYKKIKQRQGTRVALNSILRDSFLGFDTDSNHLLYSKDGASFFDFYNSGEIDNKFANLDASHLTTGTIDPARIPVLPSQLQIVSGGDLTALTAPQQAQIGQGSVVTTTDGWRYVYSGNGSKTVEASYTKLADITPDWTTISNRPTSLAGFNILTSDTLFDGKYLQSSSALDPSRVTQSASYRFVTDTEKSTWNAKLNSIAGVGTGEFKFSNGTFADPDNGVARDAKFGNRGIATSSIRVGTLAGIVKAVNGVLSASTLAIADVTGLQTDLNNRMTVNGSNAATSVTIATAVESNAIQTVQYGQSVITTNAPSSNASLRSAIKFNWYSSDWEIGNIRGGSTNSDGFGIVTGNGTNLRWRTTNGITYDYNHLEVTGTIKEGGVLISTKYAAKVHTHLWADITDKPTTFTPSAHTHIIGDITGLQAALDAKLSIASAASTYQPLGAYLTLSSVLTGYVVGANTAIAATDSVLGAFQKLQGQINNKQASGSYSLSSHNHDSAYLGISSNAVSSTKLATARTIAGVSFDGTANISIPFANLSSIPSTFTPSAHTHNEITVSRIANDCYAADDTVLWVTRANNRGNHFGRVHGLSNIPSYFTYMMMRETTATVYGVFGYSSDGEWYVGKAAGGAEITGVSKLWHSSNFNPATKSNTGHTHTQSEIGGLETRLTNMDNAIGGKANTAHTHEDLTFRDGAVWRNWTGNTANSVNFKMLYAGGVTPSDSNYSFGFANDGSYAWINSSGTIEINNGGTSKIRVGANSVTLYSGLIGTSATFSSNVDAGSYFFGKGWDGTTYTTPCFVGNWNSAHTWGIVGGNGAVNDNTIGFRTLNASKVAIGYANIAANGANFSGIVKAPNVIYGDNLTGSLRVGSFNANTVQKSGFYDGSNVTGSFTTDWTHLINREHADNNRYSLQIACAYHSDNLHYRRIVAGSEQPWLRVWDTGNLPNPASLTGNNTFTGTYNNFNNEIGNDYSNTGTSKWSLLGSQFNLKARQNVNLSYIGFGINHTYAGTYINSDTLITVTPGSGYQFSVNGGMTVTGNLSCNEMTGTVNNLQTTTNTAMINTSMGLANDDYLSTNNTAMTISKPVTTILNHVGALAITLPTGTAIGSTYILHQLGSSGAVTLYAHSFGICYNNVGSITTSQTSIWLDIGTYLITKRGASNNAWIVARLS